MTDLLTLAEARAAVGKGANDSTQSDILQLFISGVSEALEDRVGPVVYSTITAELHSGGRPYIHLNKSPVQGVVQVVEYDTTTAGTLTAETNSTKPDAAYLVNLVNGRVSRRSGNANAYFAAGENNVLVTYVAGRSVAGSIASKYKAAASLMLKNAWRSYEASAAQSGEFDFPNASFPRFIVPNAVKDMLADEWRAGSGTGE